MGNQDPTACDPLALIERHYTPGTELYALLVLHSGQVRDRALEAASRVPHLNPDLDFIAEAAMLHDIGIFRTRSPKIHCAGEHPYICHGHIGRELLEAEGLMRHALVCERHTGTGLTVDDIDTRDLPVPRRDMQPQSIEEVVICYADCFFSKSKPHRVRSGDDVARKMTKFGKSKATQFLQWHELFQG